MKFLEIPLIHLIPIQTNVDLFGIKRVMDYFDYCNYELLEVVPTNNGYVIGDGHHRACVLHLAEKKRARVQVLENDEEVNAQTRGVFGAVNNLQDFFRIADLENPSIIKVDSIENLIKFNMERQGYTIITPN